MMTALIERNKEWLDEPADFNTKMTNRDLLYLCHAARSALEAVSGQKIDPLNFKALLWLYGITRAPYAMLDKSKLPHNEISLFEDFFGDGGVFDEHGRIYVRYMNSPRINPES